MERILFDSKFSKNFNQNLIIVIARLSYEPIRGLEQILKKKIRNIKLTKDLLDKLEVVIKPITNKKIKPIYLKNLHKDMRMEDFNIFHTLLREEIKYNPNFEFDFVIFLRWIIVQVFMIIKKEWKEKRISNFHDIIRDDLKKFFNLDYKKNNKDNLKINSAMVKIMENLEESSDTYQSAYELADKIKINHSNITKYLNQLLKYGFVKYRRDKNKKLWKFVKQIENKEKYQQISIEKLKKLYEELGSLNKISEYLENQGFNRAYHPVVIGGKIRKSFKSINEYKKWRNDIKVNKLIKFANLKGGKFLGNHYLGMNTPHIFYCEKHKKKFNMTPECLINRGQWCPKCGHERAGKKQRLKIEDLEEIIKKRGGRLISKAYGKNQCDPIMVECKMGHKFSIMPKVLKRGDWCNICSLGINENITRKMFEYIFNVKFPKSTPKWLITKKGFQMHFDGYNEELAIAIEFQGKQHYQYHPYFHKDEEAFHRQQTIDLIKRKLCKENKVKLIEVPYYIKKKNRFNYIINECKKRNIKIRKDIEPKNWNDFKIYVPEKYERYKNMANSFGFELVPGTYRGFYQKATIV
ncbi:MAG: helix-turn-helix transcriptional regulator, partial [Candidatus Lokiarchaeota archaeon]|nr:helix-turn-helix transcriptional regulator [Candidatus Lokiarchaeota archaeon]